jgi:DNA-binding ferritin-like protein (Dps family)
MSRYKIQTGPDGTHWVALEPLLQDVLEQLDQAVDQLSEQQLTAMYGVRMFLQALIQEGNQQDWDKHRKSCEEETGYREGLLQ